MWEMDALFGSGIPEEWFIGGIYSTVDASTAELYISNMRKTFMEPLRDSNLIIFNRCTEDTDRLKFRRSLKALNPQVQVAFEHGDWVNVTAGFDYGECRLYGEEGPILQLAHIEKGTKPEQELVTFT